MINITRHITDRQNIITSRLSIIMLCFSIITLSLLNITFLTGTILGIPISTTSALSYQRSTDVSFAFDPILSITVSPDSITIPTIAPGTTDTSNTITVNVSTNTAYGYSLLASVGNNTQYNTSDLIHNDSTVDSTFTSIATNASLPQLDTDNTWGYSFSSNHGSTWSTYHGLPLYSAVGNNTSTTSPALLIDTKSPADSKSIDFRIAARASSTQPSGTYSNVINFYAVGKPKPVDLLDAFQTSGAKKTAKGYYKIQDMTTFICNSVEDIHSTVQLQDMRDNQIYTVAKLKDGKCWMTENLNLAGGTEITSELSDIPEGYTLPMENGFQSGNRLPNSNNYFYSDTAAVVYNTGNKSDDCASPGCYSYYTFVAATAGSHRLAISTSPNAPYSICPKNWKLADTYDSLVNIYGGGQNFYANAGPGTIPNFILSGVHEGWYFYSNQGYYLQPWAFVAGSSGTWYFWVREAYANTYGTNSNKGASVRCVAR